MITRPLYVWILFGLSLTAVLAAMGWVSLTVLDLEEERTAAGRRAALEEDVRLALWSIDSAAAPLIAQESTRPYFVFRSFYDAGGPDESSQDSQPASINLQPSVLLTQDVPYIALHFQIDPDGALTSPQAPTGPLRALAEERGIPVERMNRAADKLTELTPMIEQKSLLIYNVQEVGQIERGGAIFSLNLDVASDGAWRNEQNPSEVQQSFKNSAEFNRRAQASQQIVDQNFLVSNGLLANNDFFVPPVKVELNRMTPFWFEGMLLFVRRVNISDREYLQGCVIDWPAMRGWLLGMVADLLPGADLLPLKPGEIGGGGRRLASLPLRIDPGPGATYPTPGMSPLRISLVVAWACALLAVGAVGLLLMGALSLSERRGAFVSAVTHELRTPLTTLRMYTEMLAGGMVPDETKRQHYLDTLHAEADRLGHLVENVLAYARLERGSAKGRIETLNVDDLTHGVRGVLEQRAAQTGLELVLVAPGEVASSLVRADITAVEQILFNLVDNACKYALPGEEKRVTVEARSIGAQVALRVRDHGPGIAPSEAQKLFKPFRKSARDAANSAPGVGLGLALSRRLARMMEGDLRLEENVTDGACFVLTLPRE